MASREIDQVPDEYSIHTGEMLVCVPVRQLRAERLVVGAARDVHGVVKEQRRRELALLAERRRNSRGSKPVPLVE
jgi:hypothetical protein